MLGYLIVAAMMAAAIAYIAYPPFREWVRGFKTIGSATVLGILGVLQQFDLTDIFSDKRTIGLIMLGVAVLMAVLRSMTAASITGK